MGIDKDFGGENFKTENLNVREGYEIILYYRIAPSLNTKGSWGKIVISWKNKHPWSVVGIPYQPEDEDRERDAGLEDDHKCQPGKPDHPELLVVLVLPLRPRWGEISRISAVNSQQATQG